MASALRSSNQELLRQLQSGQEEMRASLRRIPGFQSPKSPQNTKRLQERTNLAIRADSAFAKSKLAAKATGRTVVFQSPESAVRPASSPAPQSRESTPREITTDSLEVTSSLLEAAGNLRQPKRRDDREEEEEEDETGLRSILSRSGVQRRTTPTRVHFDASGAANTEEGRPGSLLGYDWIAGMLENCGKMEALEHGNDYFNELRQFRRQHKDECVSREFRHESLIEDVLHDLRPGQRVDIQPRSGQLTVEELIEAKDNEEPVFSYTVNERLFPTALNAETENREPGTPDAPQIIKVSIPSYRLQQRPSRLLPHRRRSIEEADSCSLVRHCQVGFHPSQLVSGRPAPGADLPSAVDADSPRGRRKPQSEAEALAAIRKTMKSVRKPPVDLQPTPAPRVIEAVLTRKQMADSSVTARCEAVRRAGAARPLR